jgi:hypothetical protein
VNVICDFVQECCDCHNRSSSSTFNLKMDHLTEEQKVALEQLQSITNSSDDDVTVSVLQSVDWDVQVNYEILN